MRTLIKASAILTLMVIILLPLTSCKFFKKEKKPNVIFLMLDTLRADHMGVYGFERNTSPNLDQFARENLLFKNTVAASPWTPPSVAGMLTGLYPASHNFMPPNNRTVAKENSSFLSPAALTLQEILQSQGYSTHAYSPNPWITKEFGFDQGFDSFEYFARAPAETITREAMKKIEKIVEAEPNKPFFMYLHYLDVHEPYEPQGKYKTMYQGGLKSREYSEDMLKKINLYNGEISYLDEWMGKLFNWLKEKNLYEDSIIVVIGDHGEQFMEHGQISHGNQLVNPELHVPLIIKTGKKAQKRVVNYISSTIDIFPTILDLIGLEPPKHYQSVSLLDDQNSAQRGGVISEIHRTFKQRAFTSYEGKRVLIGSATRLDEMPDLEVDPLKNVIGVFDIVNDIWEQKPINNVALQEELLNELNAEFDRARRLKLEDVGGKDISEETIKQLESLGYLK